MIPELADENTQYDWAIYYEYLLRAAESMLLPFRYTRERLDEILRRKTQMSLSAYSNISDSSLQISNIAGTLAA